MFNDLFKIFKLSSRFKFIAQLVFIIGILLSFSCGKRTPPLPPIEKIPQRVEISGLQKGNQIIILWQMPKQNTVQNSLLNISRAEIYRLVEPNSAAELISESDFSARSVKIASLPTSDEDFKRGEMQYTDFLEFSGQPVKIRYAARFINSSGQRAGFSNFLTIEPTAKVAKAPNLSETNLSQEEILLKWSAPQENVDGSKPANIVGYNLYRNEKGSSEEKLLNSSPITNEFFGDKFFSFGESYKYFVRAISVGADGQPIESDNSNFISINPKDTFAPNAPESVTIAASPATVSIFFAANTEKDIAGYKIFRSADRNLPLETWFDLTPELLKTNTLQDSKVESGKTYFYFVTAVDIFGNESRPSEIVGETVP